MASALGSIAGSATELYAEARKESGTPLSRIPAEGGRGQEAPMQPLKTSAEVLGAFVVWGN